MRMLSGLILLIFCQSLVWAQAPGKLTVNVDPAINNFTVSLPANPTTGYEWQLKSYDQSFQLLAGSKYVAPKSKLMGAGGTMVFTFVQRKNSQWPTQTTMQFIYAQPWEPNQGTATEVQINFSK